MKIIFIAFVGSFTIITLYFRILLWVWVYAYSCVYWAQWELLYTFLNTFLYGCFQRSTPFFSFSCCRLAWTLLYLRLGYDGRGSVQNAHRIFFVIVLFYSNSRVIQKKTIQLKENRCIQFTWFRIDDGKTQTAKAAAFFYFLTPLFHCVPRLYYSKWKKNERKGMNEKRIWKGLKNTLLSL